MRDQSNPFLGRHHSSVRLPCFACADAQAPCSVTHQQLRGSTLDTKTRPASSRPSRQHATMYMAIHEPISHGHPKSGIPQPSKAEEVASGPAPGSTTVPFTNSGASEYVSSKYAASDQLRDQCGRQAAGSVQSTACVTVGEGRRRSDRPNLRENNRQRLSIERLSPEAGDDRP
jgi:hypothetical protein